MSFMCAAGRRRGGQDRGHRPTRCSARSGHPPPARVCAGPPLPARRRPIGAGRARPTRERGRARAAPPHWPARGPRSARPAAGVGGRNARGAEPAAVSPSRAALRREGRRGEREVAREPRPPDTGPGCGSAARSGGGRAGAAPQSRRGHHLRGLCRRPESTLRRSRHFLAGEPWLSGGSSGRSSSGCGASPQPPLLSGGPEGWKPFCSSPPSSEQEAAAGGGGPAGAEGWARSCSPMAAASPLCLPAQVRLGAAEPPLMPAPVPAARSAGMRRPPPRTAQASCPQRAAEGRPPPSPGTRRPPPPRQRARSRRRARTCGPPPATPGARRGGGQGTVTARCPRHDCGVAWLRAPARRCTLSTLPLAPAAVSFSLRRTLAHTHVTQVSVSRRPRCVRSQVRHVPHAKLLMHG